MLRHFSTDLPKELRIVLKWIVISIAFGQIGFSVTEGPAVSGFIRTLNPGDFLYSAMMAIPMVGSSCQLLASFIYRKSRNPKAIYVIFGLIQRLIWIPVVFVPVIFPKQMGIVQALIFILMIVSSLGGAFVYVGFYTLSGLIVPTDYRGRFFSIRNFFLTVSGIVAGLLAGVYLDAVQGHVGFVTVFTAASILGAIDILCFIKINWPGNTVSEQTDNKNSDLRKTFSNLKLIKLTVFWTIWYFVSRMSSPFFTLYQLENLHLSFLNITILSNVTYSIAVMLTVTRWGMIVDKYGYKAVVQLCCFGAALTPFFWVFVKPGDLILVGLIQGFSGIFWCALDLSAINLMMNTTSEKDRSVSIAIFSISTQLVGSALSMVTGGWLVDRFFTVFDGLAGQTIVINRYTALFVFSGILRLLVLFIFIKLIDEPEAASLKTVITHIVRKFFPR